MLSDQLNLNMKNDTNTKQFIANMVDKNYKGANESLQKVIEDKLKQRIQQAISQKK